MRVNCHHVSKIFKSRNGIITALRNISFHTEENEFLCILGPSGCGKTTLLRIIAGLLKPSAGSVTYENTNSQNGSQTALVFQEHGIFPWMNVINNICFGLEMRGIVKSERYRLAMPLINRMGLTSFINHFPNQLSSGMKQRVGIARALVSGADMLLMDEPFAALDAQMRFISQEQLLEIHREYHISVIYVTHDIEEAMLLADRIIVMTARPGQIKDEVKVSFDRKRNINSENTNQFVEMKVKIWDQIKEEVEKGLEFTS